MQEVVGILETGIHQLSWQTLPWSLLLFQKSLPGLVRAITVHSSVRCRCVHTGGVQSAWPSPQNFTEVMASIAFELWFREILTTKDLPRHRKPYFIIQDLGYNKMSLTVFFFFFF